MDRINYVRKRHPIADFPSDFIQPVLGVSQLCWRSLLSCNTAKLRARQHMSCRKRAPDALPALRKFSVERQKLGD